MIYKDLNNNLHSIDSVEYEYALPEGSVRITDAQAAVLRAPSLATLRLTKISEIKAHREATIAAKVGVPADVAKFVYQNTNPADHSPEMKAAYAIYAYSQGKINQAKSATKAQLTYDPATDVNWPK